jgi:hypothetical protein
MKNIATAFMDALLASRDKGIVPRQLLWVIAKDRTSGAATPVGFWTGDEDMSVNVVNGTTGLEETRSYYGAINLTIPSIPRVSDLTIQTVTIDLSQIAPAAQLLLRGYDVRLAKVEIHDLLLDTKSRLPVSLPQLAFLGEVDGAPITTPPIGQAGKAQLKIVSDGISMLARKNPRKSSYESQKRRSGDEWGIYASTVATWDIPWGQKS